MKKITLLFILVLSFTGCKNENKTTKENNTDSYAQNDGLVTIKGDFVYYADAAVLVTASEIYGVLLDANMHKLDAKVNPFKKEPTDMVPVTVRVKKIKKIEGEEGWPYNLEIKEILKVEAPQANTKDVIKIGN